MCIQQGRSRTFFDGFQCNFRYPSQFFSSFQPRIYLRIDELRRIDRKRTGIRSYLTCYFFWKVVRLRSRDLSPKQDTRIDTGRWYNTGQQLLIMTIARSFFFPHQIPSPCLKFLLKILILTWCCYVCLIILHLIYLCNLFIHLVARTA